MGIVNRASREYCVDFVITKGLPSTNGVTVASICGPWKYGVVCPHSTIGVLVFWYVGHLVLVGFNSHVVAGSLRLLPFQA